MQCSVKVTPRACRANGPTQGCLTKIYETMKAPSNSLLIQLMEQGNWESLQSMKPYKKAAVRLALPATHYSSTTIRPTATHDDRLQQHREEMIKNGYVVIMVPTVATRDFTIVEEWIDVIYHHSTSKPTIGSIAHKIIATKFTSHKGHKWVISQTSNWKRFLEIMENHMTDK